MAAAQLNFFLSAPPAGLCNTPLRRFVWPPEQGRIEDLENLVRSINYYRARSHLVPFNHSLQIGAVEELAASSARINAEAQRVTQIVAAFVKERTGKEVVGIAALCAALNAMPKGSFGGPDTDACDGPVQTTSVTSEEQRFLCKLCIRPVIHRQKHLTRCHRLPAKHFLLATLREKKEDLFWLMPNFNWRPAKEDIWSSSILKIILSYKVHHFDNHFYVPYNRDLFINNKKKIIR